MTSKPVRQVGPARVFRLGTEPLDDLGAVTTASERLEMVAILSARVREMSGVADTPLRRDCIVIRPLKDA
jgi:hypothetical protein